MSKITMTTLTKLRIKSSKKIKKIRAKKKKIFLNEIPFNNLNNFREVFISSNYHDANETK